MAPVLSGLAAGQVALEVREERAEDVALTVLLFAEIGLGEVVATVEHPPLEQVCG
jgi:hypothetical protein